MEVPSGSPSTQKRCHFTVATQFSLTPQKSFCLVPGLGYSQHIFYQSDTFIAILWKRREAIPSPDAWSSPSKAFDGSKSGKLASCSLRHWGRSRRRANRPGGVGPTFSLLDYIPSRLCGTCLKNRGGSSRIGSSRCHLHITPSCLLTLVFFAPNSSCMVPKPPFFLLFLLHGPTAQQNWRTSLNKVMV